MCKGCAARKAAAEASATIDRLESPTPSPIKPDHCVAKSLHEVNKSNSTLGAADMILTTGLSSPEPLVTVPSRPQAALSTKPAAIAPKDPKAPLPAQSTPYLAAFEDLRKKTRTLSSDLSCLRGEFAQRGVPNKDHCQVFTTAGYGDLRDFQKTEMNITKIIKRITNRGKNSAAGRGTTHIQDLESEAAIDKESLNILTAEYESKKKEITELRLKLEAVNPHPKFGIHEYDCNVKYQLIGNQTLPSNYRRPNPKLAAERSRARKRTSEAMSQGNPQPTPPPTRRASQQPRTILPASRASRSSVQSHQTIQVPPPPSPSQPQSFPPYSGPYNPPSNPTTNTSQLIGSTSQPIGNASQASSNYVSSIDPSKPPPAPRPKLAVSMHSDPDIIACYTKDIQFWKGYAEKYQNEIDTHQHRIADHKNQIGFHQNQIAVHQQEITSHQKAIDFEENGVTKTTTQLKGVFDHVQRKMNECSGSILDVANQQRRNIEEHAAGVYPDYTQVHAYYKFQKEQCDDLDKSYNVKKARNESLDAQIENLRKENERFEANKAARDNFLKEIEGLKAGKAAFAADTGGEAGAQHNGNAQVQRDGGPHNGNAQAQNGNTEAEVHHTITVAQSGNAEARPNGGSHTG